MKKWKILGIFFLLILFVSGCRSENLQGSISENLKSTEGKVIIHFLDVGQADSTFIELPGKRCMLIDAGEKENEEMISNYIKKLGYQKLDYFVMTHPHSDHIGGAKGQIETFDIGAIYLPKAVTTSKTYLHLLTAIEEKGKKITTGKQGVIILDEQDLKIEILSPTKEEYKNLNNYSIVLKMAYKNKSFLFMGDAETLVEEDLGKNVKADVIKIGHHGSDTSSSIDFVKKVNPSLGIISVGKDNTYQHPSKEIIKRWETVGTKIYRTDEEGTIILETDGNEITVKTSRKKENLGEQPSDKHQESLIIESITTPVKRGEFVEVKMKGKKNTLYQIQVIYSSGASSAKGLEEKMSDDEGNICWRFQVSSRVNPGTYEVKIFNSEEETSTKLQVTE